MDTKRAILAGLSQADGVVHAYLADMTTDELRARPVAGINPVGWQVGHVTAAEAHFVTLVAPGQAPALPAGFTQRHAGAAAASDDPSGLLTKEQYVRLARDVRAATVRVVEALPPADLDRPLTAGVPPFVKTVGELLVFLGVHWLMHAGQWVAVRRALARKPLF